MVGLTEFGQTIPVRRAHIDVVDARELHGLWMMHVCCFPVLTNDASYMGLMLLQVKTK